MTVLPLLASGPKRATYEDKQIVFEDGTEVRQRVMGYLCNVEPSLVLGTLRLSLEGNEVVGYLYEIMGAGRHVLGRRRRALA